MNALADKRSVADRNALAAQRTPVARRNMLPRWLRITMVGMLVLSVAAAWNFRGSVNSQADDQGEIVASRTLFFTDLAVGGIRIDDGATGEPITTLRKGEDGFMRSVMRGMARGRKAEGLGREQPFELIVWESGLLSLRDPATGRRVELSAFGRDNVRAFSRLLSADAGVGGNSSAGSNADDTGSASTGD